MRWNVYLSGLGGVVFFTRPSRRAGRGLRGPEPYRGNRLRLSAEIRSEDAIQGGRLWMRVDGPKEPLAFDNLGEHPIRGTTGWNRYQIVLDVAPSARSIVFGVMVYAQGRVFFRDVNLETVDASVETTD